MNDSRPGSGESAPRADRRTPWWKRRWRRLPFWTWTAVVLTLVAVVGALVSGGSDDGNRPAVAGTPGSSAPPSATADRVTDGDPTSPSPDATTPVTLDGGGATIPAPQPRPTATVAATTVPPTGAPPAPSVARATTIPAVVPPPGEVWAVVSVTDGDTLEVTGPDGRLTVRLIGINSPERGECWSDEATAALSALVAGGAIALVRDVSDTDRFGRMLRYVETADGVDVGAALVESGHAISRRYEPDTSRNERYDALQAEASRSGLGQWAADACGAPVADAAITVEIHPDAAGDDNFNLNDEWVRFTNVGPSALDLEGWVVADESASHRYHFSDLLLAPAQPVTLYTGCGTDTPDARYWCNTGSAVWNNSGDTVFLRDPSGNNVVVHAY